MNRWTVFSSCLAILCPLLLHCTASSVGRAGPETKSCDAAPMSARAADRGTEAAESVERVQPAEESPAAHLDPKEEESRLDASMSPPSEEDAGESEGVEGEATSPSKQERAEPPTSEQESGESTSSEREGSPADETEKTEHSSSPDVEPEMKEEPSASDGGFADWLAAFKSRAANAGVSRDTLDKLDAIQPIPRVIELDRRQPERRFTLQQYLARVVPDSRVEEGRRRFAEHQELLEEIGERYGVHPRFLVALWGIETDYGRNTGGFRVLDSLATLAHEGRRAAFFETELINALKIVQQGHITPDEMLGSWAGALGQCQFMPSSFMAYAVDHTGDGRRDIWNNLGDVFASSANYLVRHGWQRGQTWGRPVSLPEDFDDSLIGLDTKKPLEEWQALGVRRPNGQDLPTASLEGSLVQPGGPGGPTHLVYDNYRTIMRWNRSHYFATAVGLLADQIVNQ